MAEDIMIQNKKSYLKTFNKILIFVILSIFSASISVTDAQEYDDFLSFEDPPLSQYEFGFDLTEAVNGQEAINIWKEWQPHLIWMDMRMPVLNGYEATKTIRNEELKMNDSYTLIIAVTASSFEEERAVVLDAGCDDFLRKPFRESDIFELMQKHLGLCFIHEDEYAETETKNEKRIGHESEYSRISENFSCISHEILKNLKKAAIETNPDKMDSVLEEIKKIDGKLACSLLALVNDFEYGEIEKLIDETDKKCES